MCLEIPIKFLVKNNTIEDCNNNYYPIKINIE